MAIVQLTPDLAVDERLMSFSMVQSGGPGGQNVNKVATAVLLRFRYNECEVLSENAKERLRQNFGSRINNNDELMIVSRECRTHEQKRAAVIRHLGEILTAVIPEPAIRIPTKAPKTPKGGGGPSTRREEPKRQRYYESDEWE